MSDKKNIYQRLLAVISAIETVWQEAVGMTDRAVEECAKWPNYKG